VLCRVGGAAPLHLVRVCVLSVVSQNTTAKHVNEFVTQKRKTQNASKTCALCPPPHTPTLTLA
jgi:hypothetical protein